MQNCQNAVGLNNTLKYMSYIDNDRLKQIVFLLIIAFLGIILFKELYAFSPVSSAR